MQLPKRGCIIRADGVVVSAWEYNQPGAFVQPVLIIETPDASRSNGYAPDDIVLDLTDAMEPGEIQTLYKEQHELVAEKQAGQWRFKKVRNGLDLPSETDAIIAARRAAKQRRITDPEQLAQEVVE